MIYCDSGEFARKVEALGRTLHAQAGGAEPFDALPSEQQIEWFDLARAEQMRLDPAGSCVEEMRLAGVVPA